MTEVTAFVETRWMRPDFLSEFIMLISGAALLRTGSHSHAIPHSPVSSREGFQVGWKVRGKSDTNLREQ
jgi:hypothetical protein